MAKTFPTRHGMSLKACRKIAADKGVAMDAFAWPWSRHKKRFLAYYRAETMEQLEDNSEALDVGNFRRKIQNAWTS
jgi:aryl-alcohol dehydrogenase-like predicted oxidoreductase